jgi:hypothetical protein
MPLDALLGEIIDTAGFPGRFRLLLHLATAKAIVVADREAVSRNRRNKESKA